MALKHEKLKVYQHALPFNARVNTWVAEWDGKHAVGDQILRAAGSITENIAMASASLSAMKSRSLDYAMGSTLECAACLDLARIKRLLDPKTVHAEKGELSQILRMLMGLRKSVARSAQVVREHSVGYEGSDEDGKGKPIFSHETLDVYQVSLAVAKAFADSDDVAGLPNPVFRRLDELLTSMVLNIAEGNGRFSDTDQARFLGTSHESVIKLAARLDLCVARDLLSRDEVAEWKLLLERVSAMTMAMIRGAKG